MFESVFLDYQVVNYDAYVQCLRRDSAEAIGIAQVSTTKQQERQTDLYDRKLKGVPVDVGDRVLLANEGEGGSSQIAREVISTLLWKNMKTLISSDSGTVTQVRRKWCTGALSCL